MSAGPTGGRLRSSSHLRYRLLSAPHGYLVGHESSVVSWMPLMRTLRVKCSKDALLTVKRSRQLDRKRMVYILVANRPYKYPNGKRRSRIIYIGTTGKGAGRPATSAVNKASEAFELRGVKTIEVHIVTCGGRKADRK